MWLFLPLILPADSAGASRRVVTKLAEGVYEIEHKNAPDHFPQGNTAVIIGGDGVLVVDSCYLPSSAREDIAQIRQWTNKPVRYLLNSHWHPDHNLGNAAYADAFPGITIIAQTETAKMMALRNPAYVAEYPHRMEKYQREIDTGKDLGGKPLTEDQKQDLNTAVSGGKAASEVVTADFRNWRFKAPDLTFDHELDVDLGNREVQLKFLGRGNTVGDAIAYLPKEKIVIAGDLVDSPVPFLSGGYPSEEVVALKKLSAMDFATLVPGHGSPLKGKAFVQQEIDLIEAVITAVTEEIARTSDDPHTRFEQIKSVVEQKVDKKAWSQKFVGDDPDDKDFFETWSWPSLIESVHAEMWPR